MYDEQRVEEPAKCDHHKTSHSADRKKETQAPARKQANVPLLCAQMLRVARSREIFCDLRADGSTLDACHVVDEGSLKWGRFSSDHCQSAVAQFQAPRSGSDTGEGWAERRRRLIQSASQAAQADKPLRPQRPVTSANPGLDGRL